MPDELKVCRKCHLELPISSFTISDAARGYRKGSCKACEAERVRGYYATNETYRIKQLVNSRKQTKQSPKTPEIQRRHMLKSKYGLSEAQFAQMLLDQGGRCALCKTDEIGVTGASGRYDGSRKWLPNSWRVDHCHKDGRVRGLLCHACNVRLGAYETLIDTVGEAALLEYLTRASPVPIPVVVPLPTPRFVAELPPRYTRGKCSVDGCGLDQHARNLCRKHYTRVITGKSAGPAGDLPHAGSILTDDNIRAIRSSPERGVRLAARYNVSQSTISLIRKRKIWTHVLDAVGDNAA